MAEVFEWKKWFSGMVDVTRILKDAGTLIRMVFIISVAYLLLVGGVSIWKRAMPKPKVPTVQNVECKGNCEISGDKKMKVGLLNIW